ncbi:MAG: hypothetical protein WCR67_01860 [Bacilli bacterium]
MNKENCKTINLEKGLISIYENNGVKLYAYKTNDYIDDEVFIVEKNGLGVSIELPCFYDNIKELESFIKENNITLVAKLVAYHGAGASFMKEVKTYGTETSISYNTVGGGAALVKKFTGAFGPIFDPEVAQDVTVLADGKVTLGGIEFVIISNNDAYTIEIPEINCVYTHMLGHDCHSIVAGEPHAEAIINELNSYLNRGFDFILTSHYTPEDQKDVNTKIAYLNKVESIAHTCFSQAEMKTKMEEAFPEYSGANYLDMSVGFFFSK